MARLFKQSEARQLGLPGRKAPKIGPSLVWNYMRTRPLIEFGRFAARDRKQRG